MRVLERLKAFFTQERVGDLFEEKEIAYQEIVDGVMLLNDGRFEVGVSVDLLPNHFSPSSERYVNTLATLLRLTPQSSRLRFVTQIAPEDGEVLAAFERQTSDRSEASRLLTEARKAQLEKLRGTGEITRWRSHISLALGRPQRAREGVSKLETAEALERAERQQDLLMRQARLAGLNPRLLGTADTFDRVFRYLNPSYADVKLGPYRATDKDYPAKAVEAFEGLRSPTLRAQLLKSEVDNNHLGYLKVGAQYVTMLALHTEPDRPLEKLGNLLTRATVPSTVVLDVWHEDQAKAINRVKTRNRQAFADAAGGVGEMYSGPESNEALSEGERLLTHLYRTGDHVYRVMCAVILTHANLERLRDATDQLLSELNAIPGMPFRKLERGIFKPWLTFAPFSGQTHNEYASLVESHAKCFFPVNGPWATDLYTTAAVALYHTRDHTLAAVDAFDPRNKNPHALFLGAPRSGKSFTAQHQLCATLRDTSVNAVILDLGLNWERTVEHYRGRVVQLDGSGAYSKNPFDLQPGQLRPNEEDRAFLLRLLRVMLGEADGARAAEEDSVLRSAITEAYAAALTEYPAGDGSWRQELEPVTLSGFVSVLETLSAVGERPVTEHERGVMVRLAGRLRACVDGSSLGSFIDRPTNLPLEDEKIVLFETSAFKGDETLMKVGTMVIQRAVWQRAIASKRTKTVLVVDEAWIPLQDDFASSYLEDILRRGAKEGLALWLITHSASDLIQAKRRGLRQALTIFFLFRLDGEDELLKVLLDLPPGTRAEYKTITGETGVQNEFLFYMKSEQEVKGEILVLLVGPMEYLLFTSHLDDLAKVERLTEERENKQAAMQEPVRRGA